MTVTGLIGVLRRVLVTGVVCGKSGEARRCIAMTAFNIGLVIAYFPTLAPINIADEFQSL